MPEVFAEMTESELQPSLLNANLWEEGLGNLHRNRVHFAISVQWEDGVKSNDEERLNLACGEQAAWYGDGMEMEETLSSIGSMNLFNDVAGRDHKVFDKWINTLELWKIN